MYENSNETDYSTNVTAFIFTASFRDKDVEFQIDDAIGNIEEAEEIARNFSEYLGRIPLAFWSNLSWVEVLNGILMNTSVFGKLHLSQMFLMMTADGGLVTV